jgi:hypothetical protein
MTNNDKVEVLKPCPNPWCAGTCPPLQVSEVFEGKTTGFKVMCFYDCNLSGPIKPTQAEAITAWNTRTPDEIVEALARLAAWIRGEPDRIAAYFKVDEPAKEVIRNGVKKSRPAAVDADLRTAFSKARGHD